MKQSKCSFARLVACGALALCWGGVIGERTAKQAVERERLGRKSPGETWSGAGSLRVDQDPNAQLPNRRLGRVAQQSGSVELSGREVVAIGVGRASVAWDHGDPTGRTVGATFGRAGGIHLRFDAVGQVSGWLRHGRQVGRIRQSGDRMIWEQSARQSICGVAAIPWLPAPSVRTGTVRTEVTLLSSRTNASCVIYLDCDGATVEGSEWNALFTEGAPIEAAPIGWSAAEIRRMWEAVSEDFAPFDVDVTTDPRRFEAAAVEARVRCIVTPSNGWLGQVGGAALMGSFGSGAPCWAFNVADVRVAAVSVSHEVGHTLGLSHDGLREPVAEYYRGHGAGDLSWGPIMGAPFGRAITQWSDGSYVSANNREDDIGILMSRLGAASDEPLPASMAAGEAFLGRIAVGDRDRIEVQAAAGPLRVRVAPAASDPNLAVGLVEMRANVAGRDAADDARASELEIEHAGGALVLEVYGAGRGGVADGFSAYGSMGMFNVTVVDARGPQTNAAPSYDMFAAAAPLNLGMRLAGTLVAATREPGEPAHGGRAASRSVWFRWDVEASCRVRLGLDGVATRMAVYTGDGWEGLSEVCAAHAGESADVWVHGGERYFIAVDGESEGAFELALTEVGPHPAAAVDVTLTRKTPRKLVGFVRNADAFVGQTPDVFWAVTERAGPERPAKVPSAAPFARADRITPVGKRGRAKFVIRGWDSGAGEDLWLYASLPFAGDRVRTPVFGESVVRE